MSNRTIATVEELDALPKGSVILAANGEPFIAANYDRWNGPTRLWGNNLSGGAFESAWFAKSTIGAGLPATLLHEPDAS